MGQLSLVFGKYPGTLHHMKRFSFFHHDAFSYPGKTRELLIKLGTGAWLWLLKHQ
jgi:hypothetical protein